MSYKNLIKAAKKCTYIFYQLVNRIFVRNAWGGTWSWICPALCVENGQTSSNERRRHVVSRVDRHFKKGRQLWMYVPIFDLGAVVSYEGFCNRSAIGSVLLAVDLLGGRSTKAEVVTCTFFGLDKRQRLTDRNCWVCFFGRRTEWDEPFFHRRGLETVEHFLSSVTCQLIFSSFLRCTSKISPFRAHNDVACTVHTPDQRHYMPIWRIKMTPESTTTWH